MKTSKVELWIGGSKQSVTPIYADKTSIDKERDNDEMYYRTKLNGGIKFVGADFDLIEGQGIDTEMLIKVYDVTGEVSTLLVEGKFTKMDCTFNYDDKVVEVKVTSLDVYDKILGGMGNEYDLISLAPERKSVTLAKRGVLQIYRLRDTKITNVIGNMSYEVDVNSEVDLESLTAQELVNDYHFARAEEDITLVNLVITNTGGVYDDIADAAGIYEGGKNDNGLLELTKRDDSNYKLFEVQNTQGNWTLVLLYKNLPIVHHDYEVGNVHVGSTPQVGRINFERNTALQFNGLNTSFTALTTLPGVGVTGELINTFSRVIMDKSVTGSYAIPTTDLAEHNLNYHYVKPYQITTIRRSFEVQDEPTKWGVNGEGKYFVRPMPSDSNNMIPIGWETWGGYSVWFECSSTIARNIDTYNSEFVLNDAYPLYSAIKVLLAKIDDTITFEPTSDYSQFLYGTTGVVQFNHIQDLYLTPITNVKRTYYDQAARKGIITLKNILDMLRTTYQLYWFVDSQKRLRLEHILWFRNGGSYTTSQTPIIDLTSIVSPMWMKVWSKGTNKVSYDAKNLVKRYEFAWAEETSEVFDGYAMDIKNHYAKDGKTLNSTIQRIVSDVDLIMSAPDALNDDNFVLIGTEHNTSVCPIVYLSLATLHTPMYGMQNGCLSFLYLESIFWHYNMGGSSVGAEDYYGTEQTFTAAGVQRVKKQSVKFPIATDKIGVEGLIKTDIGSGQWVKQSYNLEDGMVDMDIVLDIE